MPRPATKPLQKLAAARKWAKERLAYELSQGETPARALATVKRVGRQLYGAIPWATLLPLILPILEKLIEAWLHK